jgi:geranylgeranylglycerol-phosphate geranylgeranyltransferase
MMGFAAEVGAAIATSAAPAGFSVFNLVYGFVTAFALTAASMAGNDYFDREIDATNEPSRPIPSGLVEPNEALTWAVILALIGFAAAYVTSIRCLAVALLSWILFTTYTTVGKRSGLAGNFLVSMCVAMPFVYGSVMLTNQIDLNVLIFVSMVFLSNTGREITKGIVDVAGDAKENVRTLAVRFGSRTTSIVASLFNVSAVLMSPIPVLLRLVSPWYVPFVSITDVGLLGSSIALLRDHSRENARRIKRIALVWFLVGLTAFLVGATR